MSQGERRKGREKRTVVDEVTDGVKVQVRFCFRFSFSRSPWWFPVQSLFLFLATYIPLIIFSTLYFYSELEIFLDTSDR